VTNASNDLTFDSVEPPVDTSTPRSISTPLTKKKSHFNRFYEDTQRRDFRPLEDNAFFVNVFYKSLKETFKSLEKICLAATVL
jgi:hypothetical protein